MEHADTLHVDEVSTTIVLSSANRIVLESREVLRAARGTMLPGVELRTLKCIVDSGRALRELGAAQRKLRQLLGLVDDG
jgi:hypothetical protein